MVAGNHHPPATPQDPGLGPMEVVCAALDAYHVAIGEPGADVDRLKIDLAVVTLQTQAFRLAEMARILQTMAGVLDH